MTGYFLDTSALVKRYHLEQGSDTVGQVFAEEGASSVISRLGIVETVSALALKVRTGELELSDYTVARKKFLATWASVQSKS